MDINFAYTRFLDIVRECLNDAELSPIAKCALIQSALNRLDFQMKYGIADINEWQNERRIWNQEIRRINQAFTL